MGKNTIAFRNLVSAHICQKRKINKLCRVFFWPPWSPYCFVEKTTDIGLIGSQSYILYLIFGEFGQNSQANLCYATSRNFSANCTYFFAKFRRKIVAKNSRNLAHARNFMRTQVG